MSNAQEVTLIVTNLLKAVERGDRAGIRAHHARDLLMFDFPDTVRGLLQYDAQWDWFFQNQTDLITFSPEEIKATAGHDVAFVSCLVHCAGTTGGDFRFRLTVGMEKRDDQWMIVHEHHSLPTQDAKMVMPEKRAALGLH